MPETCDALVIGGGPAGSTVAWLLARTPGGAVLFAVALWNLLALRRAAPASGSAKRATALAGLVLAQSALGIVTLLLVVPLWAGLAHQALGFAVLAMGVVHVTRTEQAARV